MKNYTGNKAIDGVYHKIINEIPEFSRFLELFAGSAAIAKLLCSPSDVVFINDVDVKASNNLDYYIVSNELKKWHSYNFDVFAFLEKCPLYEEDFIFFDPPYLHSTRTDKKLYTHEFSDDDHVKLLSTVLDKDCKIMIIHPKCDLYDNTLKDWRKVEIKIRYNRKTSIECLYMNYPPPTKLHNPQYTGKDSWDRQRIKRKADRWVNRLQQLPELEREFILDKIKSL